MLQITPQMRILVAVEAVDFRKGIDSLAELCRAKLNADPFSGCLFVFRSRRATSIKVLVYDLCEAPCYVEQERRDRFAIGSCAAPLHIIRIVVRGTVATPARRYQFAMPLRCILTCQSRGPRVPGLCVWFRDLRQRIDSSFLCWHGRASG